MKIKHNKWFRIFCEEEGAGGGDTESGTELAPLEGTPETNTPPPTPQFDARSFAKEFGQELGSVLTEREKAAQANAPKQYTPEEIAKARKELNFWEPDDTFLAEFGNLETQKQAFTKLRDGLLSQFMTITDAKLAQQRQQYESQLTPLQSLIQERQKAETWGNFHTAYPSLKNEKFQPIIERVGEQLAAAGKFNGLNQAQAFEVLAKGVESVFKEVNPSFSLGAPTAPTTGKNSNAITPGVHGSGAGGGNGSGKTGPASTAAAVLGDVRGRK